LTTAHQTTKIPTDAENPLIMLA